MARLSRRQANTVKTGEFIALPHNVPLWRAAEDWANDQAAAPNGGSARDICPASRG
jgi:hypothetical protein